FRCCNSRFYRGLARSTVKRRVCRVSLLKLRELVIKVIVRSVDPPLLARDSVIDSLLRPRDGFLSFVACFLFLVISSHGCPAGAINILRVVYHAAAVRLHRRGPAVGLHWRHRTTTRLHRGRLYHRRRAALRLGTLIVLIFVVFGL